MSDMSLEAFESKVLPVKDKLFRFALKIVKDEEEAKDIVQEVLIRVWDQRTRLDEFNNTEAWCMRVTRNLSIDRLKSKHISKTNNLKEDFDIVESQKSPLEKLEMGDLMSRIRQFIEGLPEKQKRIIHLRDIEGFSYKEIGKILEIDINQVKVNLFRARKSVKENLLNITAYGI